MSNEIEATNFNDTTFLIDPAGLVVVAIGAAFATVAEGRVVVVDRPIVDSNVEYEVE